MNLQQRTWNDEMCALFGVAAASLPAIRSSAEPYGTFADGPLAGVPIAGILGDQQVICYSIYLLFLFI